MDFVNTDVSIIKHLLGKSGTDLWHELRGTSVMGLELHAQLPKSIARTSSMGEVTSDRKTIVSHLIRHTSRLATELVTKKLLTKRITIFLKMKEFNSISSKTDFEYPTNNYFRLNLAVRDMLAELYKPDELYRACGIVAEKITCAEKTMPDLFGRMEKDAKQAGLFLTVDRINKIYGHSSIKMAGAFSPKQTRKSVRFVYPLIMAS